MQKKMRGSIEDDIIGISKQKKLKKPTSANKKTTTKGKVNTNYGRDQEKNQKETQKYWNEGSLHKGWTQETH